MYVDVTRASHFWPTMWPTLQNCTMSKWRRHGES